MTKSRCKGVAGTYPSNADPFFPSTDELYIVAVTQFCSFCVVREECGQFGDKYNLQGVWGGKKRVGPKR